MVRVTADAGRNNQTNYITTTPYYINPFYKSSDGVARWSQVVSGEKEQHYYYKINYHLI